MSQKSTTRMLFVLFGTAFIAAFNENIINVGLVDIMAEFAIDSATAQWLVTGYMVVTAVVVTLVAFLLKRFSVRTLFFTGTGVMLAFSLAAMLAPTFPLLLIARLLQAIGTGIFIPTMMNTVLAVAPRKKLGTYLAIGSCCITFGPAFGPVASGLMVTFFGWRSMFLVPIAAMAVLLVLGALFVHAIGETEDVHLDVPSVLLSAVGLTAFVYGLSALTADLTVALICLALGIAAIAAFAVRQNKLETPLLNLQPLRTPRFSLACVLVLVAMMTTFSMSVLLPLFFEGAAGTTALIAGVLVLIPILFNSATALLGGRIMDKRGEWPLLPAGFLLIVVGMVAICLFAGSINIALVVIAASAVYAGVGFVMSPSQTAGLKQLPRDMHPYGVGLMSTFIQIAAAVGPSLFIGVFSSTVASAAITGAAATTAQASGFVSACLVATGISAIGFVVAFVYARLIVKHAAEGAAPATTEMPAQGPVAFSLERIMKHDAFTLPSSAHVYEAVHAMLEHRTSGLPIIDDADHVVGFISDGDIMKSLADADQALIDLSYSLSVFADNEQFDARLHKLMRSNVMDVATEHVISVTTDMPIEKVCAILGERRIKKVPVLKEGTLVGTVSRADVTRSLMAAFVEKKPAEA